MWPCGSRKEAIPIVRTRKRVKINPRFYLILFLVVGLGALAIFLFKPGRKSGTLHTGTQALALEASAIVIREESCVSVERYDRATYQVQEGAQVTSEMPVATVYKWGYTDDMTQSLLSIQEEIYQKQLELLGSVESAELSNINNQLREKQQAIRQCLQRGIQGLTGDTGQTAPAATAQPEAAQTSAQATPQPGEQPSETQQLPIQQPAGEDLLALENDVKDLLAQRSALLKQLVQADEALNALYGEEETKKAQLAEYASDVVAKGSGVVSFYFDGFEQVLSGDKLDVINADVINKVLDSAAGGMVASSESLLFRLVNPSHWYIAFVTPRSQALRVSAGQTYRVQVEGYADRLFIGTALEPVVNENGVVNILEFNETLGDLIGVRTVKVTLSGEMTGLEVPLEAILEENGVPVLPVDGQKIPLEVYSADEDTAIIAAKDGASLSAGMRYGD